MRIWLVAIIGLALPLMGVGCEDAVEKPTPQAIVGANDFVKIGFGAGDGSWDELRVSATGDIRWSHLPSATSGTPGFDKHGSMDKAAAAAWLNNIEKLGVLEWTAADVAAKEANTTIDGLINGKKAKLKVAGLPKEDLQRMIDEATAHTIESKK